MADQRTLTNLQFVRHLAMLCRLAKGMPGMTDESAKHLDDAALALHQAAAWLNSAKLGEPGRVRIDKDRGLKVTPELLGILGSRPSFVVMDEIEGDFNDLVTRREATAGVVDAFHDGIDYGLKMTREAGGRVTDEIGPGD